MKERSPMRYLYWVSQMFDRLMVGSSIEKGRGRGRGT